MYKLRKICLEILIQVNNAINRVVWGIPMLALLVGGGIIFTMLTRGVQFRKFLYALQNTLGKVFTRVEAGEGEMTPFQAMSTALAGTVGTGNSAMATTAMNSQALGTVFTNRGGSLIIAVGIVLFAFSTVLGWALYGARACEFVFGTRVLKLYQALFVIVVFVGAVMDLSLVWDIADTLNGLMAIPNLIGVLALSPVVVKETKRHFDGEKFVPGSDWKE